MSTYIHYSSPCWPAQSVHARLCRLQPQLGCSISNIDLQALWKKSDINRTQKCWFIWKLENALVLDVSCELFLPFLETLECQSNKSIFGLERDCQRGNSSRLRHSGVGSTDSMIIQRKVRLKLMQRR